MGYRVKEARGFMGERVNKSGEFLCYVVNDLEGECSVGGEG